MVPKIQKDLVNPIRRPIISGNGSIAEPISKYIDFFIKPFVMELPSYIQDTTQVLKKIQTINNIGDCFMVIMDVESIYSNIVHDEGLESLRYYLKS